MSQPVMKNRDAHWLRALPFPSSWRHPSSYPICRFIIRRWGLQAFRSDYSIPSVRLSPSYPSVLGFNQRSARHIEKSSDSAAVRPNYPVAYPESIRFIRGGDPDSYSVLFLLFPDISAERQLLYRNGASSGQKLHRHPGVRLDRVRLRRPAVRDGASHGRRHLHRMGARIHRSLVARHGLFPDRQAGIDEKKWSSPDCGRCSDSKRCCCSSCSCCCSRSRTG